MITKQDKDIARRLYEWSFTSQYGFKDVLVWDDGDYLRFAFQGDALRIERNLLVPAMYDGIDGGEYLAQSLKKLLMPTIVRDLDYWPRNVQLGELLERVEQALMHITEKDVKVTIMPDEGHPYVYSTSGTSYYSVKQNKILVGRKPKGLRTFYNEHAYEEYNKEFAGIDPCSISQKIKSTTPRILGEFLGGRKFLVTHAINTYKMTAQTAKGVKSCGGLLWPSLAVSTTPATNFGSTVLIGDVSLILSTLKPYKKTRGNWNIVTYSTDAWTATTTSFYTYHAQLLYEQLCGRAEYVNHNEMHMAVLGPKIIDQTFGQNVQILKNTKQLKYHLKLRDAYKREMSEEKITDLSVQYRESGRSGLYYPFLEAKANVILDPSCFPVCVAPTGTTKQVRSWLNRAGFNKTKILTAKGDENTPWAWSWTVRDTVIKYTQKNTNLIFDVNI